MSALVDRGFAVIDQRVVPDGIEAVESALRELVDGFAGLVLTTGGTGFSPRDVTPEATLQLLERQAPGLGEAMRQAHPLGRLSRCIAGTAGQCLIVNLPGSPTAALECLGVIIEVLPHALSQLVGEDSPHPRTGQSHRAPGDGRH